MNGINTNDILKSSETSSFINNAPSASVGSNGKSNLMYSSQSGKASEILSGHSDLQNLVITKDNTLSKLQNIGQSSTSSGPYAIKSPELDLNVADALSSIESTKSMSTHGVINEVASTKEGGPVAQYVNVIYDVSTNKLPKTIITDNKPEKNFKRK